MYKHSRRPCGVVIGRFQPFHNGHKHLLTEALKQSKKICVVLGSARTAPDPKNPWTPKMREEMIRACFSAEDNARMFFTAVRDYQYNNALWMTDVRNKVRSTLDCTDFDINLFGFFKDQTSWYLKAFPNWQLEEVFPCRPILNATDIRAKFFDYSGADNENYPSPQVWGQNMPQQVIDYMSNMFGTAQYFELCKEYNYYKEYKKATRFVGTDKIKSQEWKPTFVTADAVVIQSGHVLLVKRGVNPGKGLYALPGGFVNEDETLEAACLRELKEETGIVYPVDRMVIRESKTFDHPSRSLRGRTFTHAACIVLPDDLERGLPNVKGGDDASEAMWVSMADLDGMEEQFFEDHLAIIRYFTRKL